MQTLNWCFTDYRKECTFDKKLVKYIIYQKEECPKTKKIHWQGYIELNREMSYNVVKLQVFKCKQIHVEIRQGSQQQAIDYCKKLESKIGDPIEWGKPARKGARTDLDELARLAPKTSAKRLVEMFGGNALRHINHIKSYQKCIFEPDNVEKNLQALDMAYDGKSTEEIAKFLRT